MSEKSILEQALLQVNTLEEAVKQNAKGILSSVMKQELNDLLKESQMEEEDEVKNEEVSEDVSEEKSQPEEEEKDMSEQPEGDDEESDDDSESEDKVDPENEDDLDNEDPVKGLDNLDSEMGDDEVPSLEPSMGDEMSDEDVMDMTGASDDEVLKVFKAMKPEDGIVVKKDGNNVELETGEDDFIIKLDEEESNQEVAEETSVEEEKSETEESVDEETLYEIELDEEEESKEKEAKEEEAKEEDSKEVKEVEATEAARTKWNPHGDKGGADRAGISSKKVFKAGSGLNEEVETLKKQNTEYKKALVLFKEKLNEVAVFNASLAYATRLFTEHTTTKQEKLNILKRFDSISNMNESKNLFNTIKTELENRTPISESVVDKISTSPSSSATEVLSESKAYENPQFRRMKDLMAKIK